ncbi:MAG: hypothetical protein M1818_005460 [Claussenomyces sp. TS43310]|nr:MAG: hypothetical protein M1818_005460 [Claussenomyces sp. TS43310]
MEQDLQPNNTLVGINDPSVVIKFEKYEAENPVPRKEIDGCTIYMSRPMLVSKGLPVVSDLSEDRFGDSEHTDLIMPDIYRAPEVILNMPWSYPVDIWGLGMIDLFKGNRLFAIKDQDNGYAESSHLAKMIAILGLSPLDFFTQIRAQRKVLAPRWWVTPNFQAIVHDQQLT